LSVLLDYTEMHDLLDMMRDGLLPEGSAVVAFETFCQSVGRVTAGLPESDIPASVATMLPSILCQPDLLSPAQRAAPETGYERHTLFICPRDRYSIMAVVWPAGIVSPIHDHSNWCAFGVYEGVVEETFYGAVSSSDDCSRARAVKTVSHHPGAVAHMPAAATHIHRVHNPGAGPAISLHVYGGNCEKLGPNVDTVYRAAS
jgi:predicted metal-dependent enzyme (double-stranded beta helix superfamily)